MQLFHLSLQRSKGAEIFLGKLPSFLMETKSKIQWSKLIFCELPVHVRLLHGDVKEFDWKALSFSVSRL